VGTSNIVPLYPGTPRRAVVRQRAEIRSRGVALLTTVLLTSLVLLIGLQIRAWNGSVNADGISYIELGAQYARGDLSALTNGYWSPLYPILLGIAFRIAQLPAVDLSGSVITPELRIVLAVNVAVAILATILYARLLLELDRNDNDGGFNAIRVARFAAAGSLWVWWIVRFSSVTTTTPDLLLAACLAATMTELVIAAARPSTWGAVRLGIALAIGFWTKAVFFLVMPVSAIAYLLLVDRATARRHAPFLILTAVVLSAPLVLVQSTSQGRFSFGETGRLNYGWYVNGEPRGTIVAESRAESRDRRGRPGIIQMDAAPGVLLYSGESAVSFPYWYDPSRYEPLVKPKLSVANQWRTLKANARWFRVVGGAFSVFCLVALGTSSRRRRLSGNHLVAALPALALIALHALTHPEGRLAGSAIVCSLAMIVFWRGRQRATPSRAAIVLSEATVLCLIPLMIAFRLSSQDSLREQRTNLGPGHDLTQAGVAPGSRIGLLASPYGHYWAHQLGLHISVAGVPSAEGGPPGRALLSRIAEESCDRGVPLEAILWRKTQGESAIDAQELAGGWLMWRPPHPCATQSALSTHGNPRQCGTRYIAGDAPHHDAVPVSGMTRAAADTAELSAAVDAVRRLIRGLRLAEQRTRTTTGLSAAQLFVLGQLRDADGVSLTELAERTLTDRTSVSAVVERLERDGSVRSERDPRDRRRTLVRITAAGRRRLSAAPRAPTAQLLAALRRLEPRQRRGLTSHLVALLDAMGLAEAPATMLFEERSGRSRRVRA
jgi:DNA-binding MarR family transcriptional regulator